MTQCLPGMSCWENTTNNEDCGCSNVTVNVTSPCGCIPCDINSTCVFYTGNPLPNSLINTNDNLTLALSKLDAAIITVSGAVPNTRTITINGITQDLSSDRTWNVGDILSSGSYINPSWITSLAYSKITGVPAFITLTSLSAGTGISYNNTTGVITNSAPDQVVTLTQGSNVTITGSYPNFTISASGGGGGSPAGSNTQVQFNNSGSFGADSLFTFDNGLHRLFVNGADLGGNGGFNSMPGLSAVKVEIEISNNSGTLDSPLRVSHFSSAPGIGIGSGIDFASVTSTGAAKIGSRIGNVATNVGVGTEAFDFVIYNMLAGATSAEAFRILSTGNINFGSGLPGGTRILQATGTATDVGVSIVGKGIGAITFTTNGAVYSFNNNTFSLASSVGSLSNSSGTFLIASGGGNPGKPLSILSGDGASSGQPSGAMIISTGNGNGTGNSANLSISTGTGGNSTGNITINTGNATTASGNIFLQTGTGTTRGNLALFSSIGSFGSGQQVVFVADATTEPTSNPTGGSIFYSFGGILKRMGTNGPIQSFPGIIYKQNAYKTVSNTVAETSTLNSTITLPANTFTVGKSIRIKLAGFHSAVTTPTIDIKVKLGSVIVNTTGIVNSGNSTNAFCEINSIITCYTTGVTGTVSSQGFYKELGGGLNEFPMVTTSSVTIDTTSSQVLDVTVTWGTASSSNTITFSDGYVEILN